MIWSWDIEWQTEIQNYGSFFALPLKTQNRILKSWKKLLKISPFYMCILKTKIIAGTNPGYRVRQKIKILKKWKKHLEILSFYMSVPKIMIICYTVPEIWHVADVILIFSFWAIFYPFTSLTTHKIKIKKKEKNPVRYHHFTWCMIPAIYEIQQTKFFVILNNFLPFYLLTTQKIKILKKRKNLDRLSFYTCVPQMTII